MVNTPKNPQLSATAQAEYYQASVSDFKTIAKMHLRMWKYKNVEILQTTTQNGRVSKSAEENINNTK